MGQLSGYITLIDVSDGAPGLNNAIIYLYKRATSTPSNMPTGNLTYTFSTNTITAVEADSSLNGWVQDISTLSGNNTLYFIAATASSTTDTDIIADTEWQGPTLLAESGDDGKGIITTTLTYGISSSSTIEPANWYPDTPTLNKGDWLWIRTVYTYSDSTTSQFDTKSYIGTDGEDGTSIAIISSTKVGKVTTIVMRETYADGTYTDSTITITDGEDGSQGQPGQPGTDGRTPYMHFAWANTIGPTSADFEDFSTTVSENKNYIGVYSDYTINDSVNPLDYSWTLTKGVKGDDGTTISTIEYSKDGTSWSELQPALTQGDWLYVRTTYTDGSSATSKSYIGTDGEDGTAVSIVSSTKVDGVTTIIMRTTYPDSTYVDSTITITDGEDGDDGQPGQPGTDGRTPYTHFAWANAIGQSSTDFEDFSTSISTNKRYIGVFSDYNVSDSQNPLDYSWTLTKGENGTDGFNQAIIYLYQRSDETPNKPAGNLTYTFSTGVLSGSLGNWTREIPSNSSGNPCYIITAAAISRESTDTIVTNDWSTPIILVEDGTNGAPGVSTATVYLYQRKSTTPSKPTNTLTYTFATKELSGTINNGWSISLGSLTGTNPIWVIAAVPSSNTASDTITSSEWSVPIKLAQDGTNGLNQATVYIYNRSGISTKPSDTTYTFATGAFTVPTNWSKTIPTKNGNPCWVSSAVAIGNGDTATLTWSNPVVLVEDGTDGISPTVIATATGVKIVDADGNETYINNGLNGDTYYTYIRYSANADGSNYQMTPDPSRPYIGVYSGTKSNPPAYDDSGWTWSEYLGTDGVSVTNVRELYWLKTNSTNPSQIYWNSSQPSQTIYSDINPNHWTSMVPTYTINGIYYTCIETSLSNGTKVWSVPVINQALTSANTNASEALNKVQVKYATSSTSAATAAKVATINPAVNSWSLFNGAEIFVKFTNKNTATSNLTLSIKPSSTGTGTTAAGIRDANGDTLAADFYWEDNALVHFVYDGTYWRILDITQKYNKLVSDLNGLSSTVGETNIKLLGNYAISSNTISTQNKTATITPTLNDWTLYEGATITVKFVNGNNNSAPTLNINNTGAKSIRAYSGSSVLTEDEYKWPAGTTITFFYDGTYWRIQDSVELTRISTAETQIKQTSDNVLIQATKNDTTAAAGGASLIQSIINVATSGIQISADKVNIEGAAIFTGNGRLSETSLNNAYDENGAAAAVAATIPDDISDLSDSTNIISGKADKTNTVQSVTTESQYRLSNSSTSLTGSGTGYTWSTTIPTWSVNKYIWTRIATTYTPISGNATTVYTPGIEANQYGIYDSQLTTALSTANTANTNANSAAATVTTTQQYRLSDSSTSLTGSGTGYSWSSDIPTWSKNKYIWTRFKIDTVTVGGTSQTTYTPGPSSKDYGIYDSALTTALSTADTAQDTADAAAPKSSAVYRTQRIYYRKTTTGAPNENTTWLASSGTGYENWSLSIPQLTDSDNTKYPYLYTAVQTQTIEQYNNGNGTSCSCSTVLLDDSMTVIDGGTITTGKIAANRLDVGNWTIENSGEAGRDNTYGGAIYTGAIGVSNGIIITPEFESDKSIGGWAPSTDTLTQTWFITAGSDFGITSNGSLYASNANIVGTINAGSGTIGGFTIGSTELYSQEKTEVTSTDLGTYIGPNGFNVSGGTEATTTYFTKDAVSIGGLLQWTAASGDNESNLTINANEIIIGQDYIITEDITPQENKTYYYYSNNNTYVEFTGDTFESNVDYYELIDFKVKNFLQNAITVNQEQLKKIEEIEDRINILEDYDKFITAIVNGNDSYIDFQYKTINYKPKIKITPNSINFNLDGDENIITQIIKINNNNLMHTTFGEFENLRMRTGSNGNLTWVARSNGHLSLKVVE